MLKCRPFLVNVNKTYNIQFYIKCYLGIIENIKFILADVINRFIVLY